MRDNKNDHTTKYDRGSYETAGQEHNRRSHRRGVQYASGSHDIVSSSGNGGRIDPNDRNSRYQPGYGVNDSGSRRKAAQYAGSGNPYRREPQGGYDDRRRYYEEDAVGKYRRGDESSAAAAVKKDPRTLRKEEKQAWKEQKRALKENKKLKDQEKLARINERRIRKGKKPRRRLKSKFGRTIRGIIIALIVIILGIFVYLNVAVSKMNHEGLGVGGADVKLSVAKDLWRYKNIAVMGVDTRNMDKMEGSRTDIVLILTMDRLTGDVTLTSVYRDTYLSLDENGEEVLDKVTHAFAYNGPEGTVSALNRNLDLNIKDYIAINWETVYRLIEALDGVTVDVQDYEIDELNKYVEESGRYIKDAEVNLFEQSGAQTIDGLQAVSYARIRKVGNGDYQRSERTRILLQAAVKKAKTHPFKLNRACMDTAPYITTNMSSLDFMGLVLRFPFMKIESGEGWPYDNAGYTGASWYCVPQTLEHNVKKLHKKLFEQKNYEPSNRVMTINEQIINSTGIY